MEIISEHTRALVQDAARALRRGGRLRSPEKQRLIQALHLAERELRAVIQNDFPGLCGYLVPAPSGLHRWGHARALARAAEEWLELAPRMAAARAAQAYGLGTEFRGLVEATLAEREAASSLVALARR